MREWEGYIKMEKMNPDELTEDDFQAYEDVRQSGVTNMFMLPTVMSLSGLTKQQILCIMENYSELCLKYPNVRSLE